MKKWFFLFFVAVLPLLMSAERVTRQQALQKARQFMPWKNFTETKGRRVARRNAQAVTDAAFYVFNADDGHGYAIVSGDDRTNPILGYSPDGYIDMDNLPENIQAWFDSYAGQIEAISDNTQEQGTRKVRERINYLIKACWNQTYPFNQQCPTWTAGNPCVTGCVATAIAQVMYYYRYPEGTKKSIPGYYEQVYNIDVNELPPTTFEWDYMKNRLDGEHDTDEEMKAVATLMRYCGQALKSTYTSSETAANVYIQEMHDYFGYSLGARQIERCMFTNEQWEDIIYNELSDGRPVLYSGTPHQFICDGYEGDGYFHINWGWGGQSNGWFLLSVLNPTEKGSGAAGSKLSGFVTNQRAVIGFQPDHGEEGKMELQMLFSYDYCNETFFQRSTIDDSFSGINIAGGWKNPTSSTFTGEYGWGLYDGDALKKVLKTISGPIEPNQYIRYVFDDIEFGAGVSDGHFTIRQIYRLNNNSLWEICQPNLGHGGGSPFVSAQISGNILKLWDASTDLNDVTINSVTFDERPVSGRRIRAKINLTNHGDTYPTLWLWVEGEEALQGHCVAFVEPGETGDVTIDFITQTPGNKTIRLTLRQGYANGQELHGTLYETDLEVMESPTQQKQQIRCYGVDVEDLTQFTLDSREANVTVEIRNTGDNEYDDMIIIRLKDYYFNAMLANVPIRLKPGDITKVQTHFEHIDPGRYCLEVWYHQPKGVGLQCAYETNWFDVVDELSEPEAITFADEITESLCLSNWDLNKDGILSMTEAKAITDIGEVFRNSKARYFRELKYFTGLKIIPMNAFNNSYLRELCIPTSVTSIEDGAFDNPNLQLIEIPASVVDMNGRAFYGGNIRSMKVEEANPVFDSRDNCNAIIHTTTNTLIAGSINTVIPTSVKSIGERAFAGRYLSDIELPANISSIGERAFIGCVYLKSITSHIMQPFPLSSVFSPGTYSDAILYVPAGTKKLYQQTEGWKMFENIVEMEMTTPSGDVDGDGVVTLADANVVINYILGKSPAGINLMIADMNNDKMIDITDVTAIINKIVK